MKKHKEGFNGPPPPLEGGPTGAMNLLEEQRLKISGIVAGYLAVHPLLPKMLDQLGIDASHVTATKYRTEIVQNMIRELGELATRHDASAQEMIGACAAMLSATIESTLIKEI